MQLNVSGHHVEVTKALRGYVESKVEKIERHFDLVSDVNCILTVEKLRLITVQDLSGRRQTFAHNIELFTCRLFFKIIRKMEDFRN